MKTTLDRAKRGRYFLANAHTETLYYTNYSCPFCGSPLNLSGTSQQGKVDCPCCRKQIEIHM